MAVVICCYIDTTAIFNNIYLRNALIYRSLLPLGWLPLFLPLV